MRAHRRVTIVKRLTACTKVLFIGLTCFWVLGRAFIAMCRWSDEPGFGTCSGIVDHMVRKLFVTTYRLITIAVFYLLPIITYRCSYITVFLLLLGCDCLFSNCMPQN